MKVSLILLLSSFLALPETLFACTVTLNGEDKTDEFFVKTDDVGGDYVDCIGPTKCQDAVITGCPVVKCVDTEACREARITDFTDSVLCEGVHSCHRTQMVAATDDKPKTVSCVGSAACDVAQITGPNIQQLTCSGVKACRKVHVEQADLVKCHDGNERTPACESIATFETKCLYCGKNGCAKYINQCRFKILGDDSGTYDEYQKCQPETVIGDECPDDLEGELLLELNGKEEIDLEKEGGTRRLRGLR